MKPAILTEYLRESPIVVTGMGVHCAAGQTPEELWGNLLAGRSPAQWREVAQDGLPKRVAVCPASPVRLEAPGFRRIHRMDRSVQLACAAASSAWVDARLDQTPQFPERLGIFVGTSRGPSQKWAESQGYLVSGRMLPTLAADSTIASLSGALSATFGAKGPCLTVSATCASSAGAIALAAQQILLGVADAMLVGGAEASLEKLILTQLLSTGVLGSHEDPSRACRPFDLSRNGTILGEGSAFLVLESLASARRRGVPIHARLAGWSIGSEGGERTGVGENGECMFRVMTEALSLAGLSAAQIDYVNTHGTGTRLNDRVESRALCRLFEGNGDGALCSSTKPVTGHCMGASAAIEALISVLVLQHQWLPPRINCTEVDPECSLNLVDLEPRRKTVKAVLSNSSGFWGNNASLLFARWEA